MIKAATAVSAFANKALQTLLQEPLKKLLAAAEQQKKEMETWNIF